jgi:undecaprenyl-diphosphatase
MTGQTDITTMKSRPLSKAFPFDLRSPNWLADHPTVGWILVLFGLLLFGWFTYELYTQGPLFQLDQSLAASLPAAGLKGPAYLKYVMNSGFYLGKEVVAVLTFLHALYFFIKRYWQELFMLLSGVMGGSVMFYIISHIINRDRPTHQIWTIVSGIPSFPSGHAVTAIAFFGLLAYLIVPKISSTFWKVFVVLVAVLITLFIGFSRVFTGGHYLTDVLAGYSIGIAWSALAYTLIEIYFKKRRSRNV